MPELSTNSSITSEARALVSELDLFANRADVKEKISKAREDVLRVLLADSFQDSAAIGINLSELGDYPAFLGTLRVAAFRDGFQSEDEVHPNSDQFTLSLSGQGSTIVSTENGLRTDRYGDGYGNSLDSKWHVTPREQFHRHIAGDSAIWIVAAFHTARDVVTIYR